MADKRIRDFSAASALDGNELMHVDQSTADRRTTVDAVRNYGDTEGQTQTVGNFGYGSADGESIFDKFGSNDANAINRSGLYYVDGTTANRPARFLSGVSTLEHKQSNTSYAIQTLVFFAISESTGVAENILANRYKITGTWTAWEYSDTKARQAITTAKNEMFPVGSTYIVTGAQDPNSFLEGTWVKFGQGRTLIGEGQGTDDDGLQLTFAVGSTGGLYQRQLAESQIPTHSHTVNINTSNAGGHSHSFVNNQKAPSVDNGTGIFQGFADAGNDFRIVTTTNNNISPNWETVNGTSSVSGHVHNVNGNTGNVGSGQPVPLIEPYLTVVFWTRTA